LVFQAGSDDEGSVHVAADPSSGRVLGTISSGWVEWTVGLHRNLLSGKQGRKVVGVAGIVLFILSATGLLMWIAGPRNWSAWTSVRRDGSRRRFHFELHRASGLWAYCFLAVISFTGIERAFPEWFRQAVKPSMRDAGARRARKGVKPKASLSKSMLPVNEYLRIGRAAMPDGRAVELRLPQGGKGTVDLRFYRVGDLSPDGNHVYMDAASGTVLSIDRIADRPLRERFLAALAPIHYGEFGSLPIKTLWAMLGVTPALLFVTGLVAWWRPKRQPDRLTTRNEPEEEVALAGR
jgi:uncharacterized iron-regulated membrane protein